MSWRITPGFALPDEPEALTYIAAVEAADTAAGQAGGLELGVKLAINSFVKGCKNDGIWPAIKASCILAGARTLDGALVPLVGAAPTNFNFVAGDYNRETGLVGNGGTKYLNSNRNNNADPQNSKHIALYVSGDWSATNNNNLMGTPEGLSVDQGGSFIARDGASTATCKVNSDARGGFAFSGVVNNTFAGVQRSNSSEHTSRISGSNLTQLVTSTALATSAINILGQVRGSGSNARLAFYSIGESLDLAKLDARVTDLINAIAAAIP